MNQSFTRPKDAVQIQYGVYHLVQGTATVGKLLVTQGTAPGASTESWLLYSSYHWPSSDYPNQSITFVYDGTPISLSEFLSGAPSDATYIVASCQQQSLPR
jgi:hypothetical protein